MVKNIEWLKKEVESDGVQLEYLYANYYTDDKAIMLDDVRHLIDQLDEPGKVVTKQDDAIWFDEMAKELGVSIVKLPVIPKYIAEYLEDIREGGQNFYGAYNIALKDKIGSFKQKKWLNSEENLETFARAWLDGYTIEQPKLLTVIVKDYDKTIMIKQVTEDEAEKMMREW